MTQSISFSGFPQIRSYAALAEAKAAAVAADVYKTTIAQTGKPTRESLNTLIAQTKSTPDPIGRTTREVVAEESVIRQFLNRFNPNKKSRVMVDEGLHQEKIGNIDLKGPNRKVFIEQAPEILLPEGGLSVYGPMDKNKYLVSEQITLTGGLSPVSKKLVEEYPQVYKQFYRENFEKIKDVLSDILKANPGEVKTKVLKN